MDISPIHSFPLLDWFSTGDYNSKEMIVADYDPTPLMGQELIHRPLLLLSHSLADYVGLLFGLDLPSNMQNSDFAKTYEWLIKMGKLIKSPEGRQEFNASFKRAIDRIVHSTLLTEPEKSALLDYINHLIRPQHSCVGPIVCPQAHLYQPFPIGLTWRYLPESRDMGKPATSAILNDPHFSFLSSPSAFQKLKRLMTINLGLALTRYDSKEFYKEVKRQGDAKGYRRYTISISNIIDVHTQNEAQALQQLERFRAMLYSVFPPEYEVILFLTTNTMPPHGYLRLERGMTINPSDYIRTERR